MPGIAYPRVPGHEVIGRVEATGVGVEGWKPGDRVGVGWFGGSCGHCRRCRRGEAFACETIRAVTGVTRDGGYATRMLADVSAAAHVPDDMDEVGSAPLLCAGVTTFNARGWYSGVAADSEDTLRFCRLHDVGPMNEIYPFEQAQAAYDRMKSGQARFRVVLKMT
ncbi:alcohol dehydrogenase catalytic domain-containing protein [Enhydrobacter sp.]|jgi:D-arabinose 1-dehydrogenase-like Zn-dependent alcohol dehydrogenase|uniref:alcohol dehydrogenase catalytic domain-containing protein n=1 Tax=Enhydrobacter sp. TaxID=1894999 RepID=UPI00261164AD|nr:alcohol dehydrogenase catalytic domain-containing protein [Enhydrobacter sp.]WIM11282.1 MAG: Alcohol dehydrogenase [Enhydrobacter sp.]